MNTDRLSFLNELSGYLNINITPNIDDLININEINQINDKVDQRYNTCQSDISKKEKPLGETLNSKSVYELTEIKLERSVSKQAQSLLDFDINDRIEILLNISKLREIINNPLTNINTVDLVKINECIEEIMKSKIISNTQIRI